MKSVPLLLPLNTGHLTVVHLLDLPVIHFSICKHVVIIEPLSQDVGKIEQGNKYLRST